MAWKRSWFFVSILCLAANSFGANHNAVDYFRSRLFQQALLQSEKISADWDPQQRDCAGFIRYIFRKSLNAAPEIWRSPRGEKVSYLSGQDLLNYNFDWLGRTLEASTLETGDILAFRDVTQEPNDQWHLMLVLRRPFSARDRGLVIYHSGDRKERNPIKKVWFDDLLSERFSGWQPKAKNPRFLGVFRWKGLKDLNQKGSVHAVSAIP